MSGLFRQWIRESPTDHRVGGPRPSFPWSYVKVSLDNTLNFLTVQNKSKPQRLRNPMHIFIKAHVKTGDGTERVWVLVVEVK